MDYAPLIAALHRELPDLVVVYLFGSAARDERSRESDVDLAVLAGRRIPPLDRFRLQGDLADLLHAPVDLVDLQQASTVMRIQVLKDGIVLFDADPGARESFEANALGAYARLQERRKGILDDIQRTGRVHG